MTNPELLNALSIVCEAAEDWANELEEYIAPGAEPEMQETYKKQAEDIESALKLVYEHITPEYDNDEEDE